MKLNVQQLDAFKRISANTHGTELNVTKVVKDVLLKAKRALESKWQLSYELDYDIKSILTRAHMLDGIFNPLFYNDASWEMTLNLDFTDSDIQKTIVNFNLLNDDPSEESKEENLVYYHTPAVWVFFKWKPIFLNFNYVEALWAHGEQELKFDIEQWLALEKYYIEECVSYAKEAIQKLSNGEWYKNLILITKTWKKISWNSFWSKDGLEIRIGNDITEWKFKSHQSYSNEYEGLDLNTMDLVKWFLRKVNGILGVDMELNTKLALFGILGTIIDKVWNSGQFLMNVTITDEADASMLFNARYSDALKRTKDEIVLTEKDALWKQTYDEETIRLIQWLFATLQTDGYYISEFPMKDKHGKRSTYSWLRFLVEDKDFWINRTFWIGTNSMSKDDAELAEFLRLNT